MIPLNLRADIVGLTEDTIFRVAGLPGTSDRDAVLVADPMGARMELGSFGATLHGATPQDLEGDVLLLQPGRQIAQRLIRANSKHNTFLVTERCDQLCVMCSQPPKKTHVDYFRHFSAAAVLAPKDAVIGISGGEPTLYKDDLFRLLEFALTMRPDLRFHVLSNGQHFEERDIDFLQSDLGRRILWGVPLYAAEPELHDDLVGKAGAFERLMDSLAILCRSGAPVELRTVLMRANVKTLPTLAQFIVDQVPFADPWAIMQAENIGFAKNRWPELFFDHSLDFGPIAEAIDTTRVHGIAATLYNFPLCTVPLAYRRFAPSTISDWKRRFEPRCEGCIAKPFCSGFFEWHPDDASYERLGLN